MLKDDIDELDLRLGHATIHKLALERRQVRRVLVAQCVQQSQPKLVRGVHIMPADLAEKLAMLVTGRCGRPEELGEKRKGEG